MIKLTQNRSSGISEEEKQAARKVINSLETLVKRLKGAVSRDLEVVSVIKENPSTSSTDLFKIRHLLRRFKTEVRNRYAPIILDFAGKKLNNNIIEGYIHNFKLLEKDTKTREIKNTIQDAMQQLTEFIEEFLDVFENFGTTEQVQEMINLSQKINLLVQSIENVVEKQLKPHFEKNILKSKLGFLRTNIIKRTRLIKMLEEI